MKRNINLFILTTCLFCSDCDNTSKAIKNVAIDSVVEKKDSINEKKILTSETHDTGIFGERLKVPGDFNGDGIMDTVFESYISELTGKETSKTMDSADWERNVDLIINNKPVSRIYINGSLADTFILTNKSQQAGVFLFENLGDINKKKGDELGYIINWADNSNLNSYHILTLEDNKKWKELFVFSINESVNFEKENLFKNNSVVLKEGSNRIRYKFYSDSATVEEGITSFK